MEPQVNSPKSASLGSSSPSEVKSLKGYVTNSSEEKICRKRAMEGLLVEGKKNKPTQLALVMEQVEGKSLRALNCFQRLRDPSPPPFAVLLNHVHLPTVEPRPTGGRGQLCWNEQALHLVWELQPQVLCLTDPVPKAVSLGRLRLPQTYVWTWLCVHSTKVCTRGRGGHALSQTKRRTQSKNLPEHKMIQKLFTKFI